MTDQRPTTDPIAVLLDAAAARAVDAALERLAELSAKAAADVLDDEGAMQLLGISRPSLRRALSDGLPHCCLWPSGPRRYRRTAVLAWLAEREQREAALERDLTEVFGE